MGPQLRLRPFTEPDLVLVEPWFDDAETKRYLGGRDWPRETLALVRRLPLDATDRRAWLAFDGDSIVGLADVETYGDGTASVAVVIDPARRSQGHGARVLELVCEELGSRGVHEVRGGVHIGNVASHRCALRAGFAPVSPEPDEDGFVDYSRRIG